MATELTKVTFPDGNYIINSDEKVKQKNYSTYNEDYRILFSGSADDTEHIEEVGKSAYLKYNPWAGRLKLGGDSIFGVYSSIDTGTHLEIYNYDILLLNNTWDGTHTSLKNSIPNVKQSPNDSTDAEYRILFSNTADDTERTEKVQKNSDFSFNPLKSTLKIGRAFSSGGVTGTRDTSIGIPGIDISEYVGSTLQNQLSLRKNDITLSSTWDGTNTSLKDTITYLGSQSAANKVDKSGDTMSGQLAFSNNDTANITVPPRALMYINPTGVSGIYAKPTLINNVETYANIPNIILKGAKWYSSIGT